MAVSYPPAWFSTKWHVVEGRFGICQKWKDQQTPRLLTNESSLLDFFGFGAGSMLFSGKPLIWKWDDPTKSFQNHQGWSPPKSFPTTKANKFRKENLHSSRVDYARLGPATAWVSNIWLLPQQLWWLQLGGLRDRLGWGWWRKRGQGD